MRNALRLLTPTHIGFRWRTTIACAEQPKQHMADGLDGACAPALGLCKRMPHLLKLNRGERQLPHSGACTLAKANIWHCRSAVSSWTRDHTCPMATSQASEQDAQCRRDCAPHGRSAITHAAQPAASWLCPGHGKCVPRSRHGWVMDNRTRLPNGEMSAFLVPARSHLKQTQAGSDGRMRG